MTETSLDGLPRQGHLARLLVALDFLWSALLSEVFKRTVSPTVGGYYRLRAFQPSPQNLSCLDLFHVPFSKQTLVAPAKIQPVRIPHVSISEAPHSSVGMKSSNRHSTRSPWYATRCANDSSHPLLYLAFHPKRIPRTLRSFLAVNHPGKDDPSVPARVLYAIIVTFPLILSCHFKVQFPNDPFKPEIHHSSACPPVASLREPISKGCVSFQPKSTSTKFHYLSVSIMFSPVPQQRDRYSYFLASVLFKCPIHADPGQRGRKLPDRERSKYLEPGFTVW